MSYLSIITIIILYFLIVLFYIATMVYLLFFNRKIIIKYVKALLNYIEDTFGYVLIDDDNLEKFIDYVEKLADCTEKFIDYSYDYLCEIIIKIQEFTECIYTVLNLSYELIDFINNLIVTFHAYFHLGLFMICFKMFLSILALYYLITNRPSSK